MINPCVFRFIISAANHYNLDLITLDVKIAFLYGDIGYQVYIEISSIKLVISNYQHFNYILLMVIYTAEYFCVISK